MRNQTINPLDLSADFISPSLRGQIEILNGKIATWDLRRRKYDQAVEVARQEPVETMRLDRVGKLSAERVGVLQEELSLRRDWSALYELRREEARLAIDGAEKEAQETRQQIRDGLVEFGYSPMVEGEHQRGRVTNGMVADHPQVVAADDRVRWLEAMAASIDLLGVNLESTRKAEAELQSIRERQLVHA